jgi:predicted flap endonuclease-1-like 5' DNA nuclease
MRLDYPLYLLALVFFALSAISYVLLSGSDAQFLFVVATIVLGFLSIGAGIAQRPQVTKTEAPQVPPPPPVSEPEPAQQYIVPPPPTETTKVELSKTEIVAVEPTPIAVPEKTETTLVESKPVPQVLTTIPEPQSTPSAKYISSETVSSQSANLALSQIRGISAARSEQLKANGINSVSDLANASAEELAAKIGISPKIVKMWIGSAKKLGK